MKFIPVKVECHSGYRADEYPVSFYRGNIRFEIREIVDRWYQADPTSGWPEADYFKVYTFGNSEFILKHELKSDQWFVGSAYDAVIPYSSN